MDAFFRLASGGSSVEQFAREVHTKAQLTSQINSAVRTLQREYLLDNDFSNRTPRIPIILAETSSPAVVDLCNLLEASLLHGLKAKLSLSSVATAMLGPKSPNYNQNEYQQDYWSIILILCHNQVSDNLMKLSNICTEIGRCRAWLRQTLNDGLFGSYLEALTHDTSLLHGFYRSSAYIRDRDHMELLRSVFDGLDAISFQLNYDCSSLNNWSLETLKMIGVAVQVIPDPVMPAVDALDEVRKLEIKQNRQRRKELRDKTNKTNDDLSAETEERGSGDVSSLLSSEQSCSQSVVSASTDAHEKEMLESQDRLKASQVLADRVLMRLDVTAARQIVPSTPTPDIVITPIESLPESPSDDVFASQLTKMETPSRQMSANSISSGNSINRNKGWSTSPPRKSREYGRDIREESYESVLASYSTEVVLSSTPDVRELNFSTTFAKLSALKNRSFSMFDGRRRQSIANNRSEAEVAFGSIGDFEVVPKSIVLNNAEPETQEFLAQLCRLGNEVGLDQQNYKCNSCGRPVGMIYGKSRICKFDGYNYCIDCHANEEMVIPARVLHNWDFKKYPVAKRNKNFLSLTDTEPLLDVKITSPVLYQTVPELQQCLDLRTQLFYLHAYIFTCAESVTLELRKILWPKEHLFEHIHVYSCQDLIQLSCGQLAVAIKKAITFAKKHVLSCPLCSQKGFICETCKDDKIIYPFDTESTYRCDSCKAVFHKKCALDETTGQRKAPCPRCLRIERREKAEHAAGT